jgi:pimeloyl-ACP methyl ester carboxylesterase
MRAGAVHYLLAGAFYRMAWVEFGDRAAPPVICVHGLTRNGRDFDTLAEALSDRFRVICPDLPGRGASEWLPDPALYQPPSYVVALGHLLAAVGRPVHWVGTSLGGICGMLVAAAAGQPIARLVLNDVGAFIPKAALARIRGYIGDMPEFDDLAALEAHLRRVHAPFGALTDAQWRHLATHSARTLPNGKLALHYDPAIAAPIVAAEPADVALWPFWQRVTIPTLTIRGASSDLLLAETLTQMGGASYVVADAGHAPALMDTASIAVIRDFLTG